MELRTGAEGLPKSDDDPAKAPRPTLETGGTLRFSEFEFDLRRGELRSSGGAPIPLRPKTDALLRQFLAQPGRLLGKGELMAALWPASIVTDDSLVQCVGDLRAALDDVDQQLITTVPRRGYRLEAVVARVLDSAARAPAGAAFAPPRPVAAASPGSRKADAVAPTPVFAPVQAPAPTPRQSSEASVPRWPAVAIIAIALLIAGAFVTQTRRASSPVHIDEAIAARATIAVMPFAVSNDEAGLRNSADAVADEITAQLSTRLGMRGIGRAATAAYDSSAPPLARIASALKATSVVTGRVSRSAAGGDALAIDVQMIAVDSGEVVWARHFELPAAGFAGGASDVGQHVVNAVRSRGGKLDNPITAISQGSVDPVDLTLLGWNDLDRQKSVVDLRRARGRFEAALRSDPDSVIALNGVAASYAAQNKDLVHGLTAEEAIEYDRAVERARRLAPNDGTALLIWGEWQMVHGHAELALPAIEASNRLVPSYTNGHVLAARALLMLGRTEDARAEADRAVALGQGQGDSRRVSLAYSLAAEADLMRGEDGRAFDLARRGVVELPSNARAHAMLAAIHALAGRDADARTEMGEFLRLWPTATVARYDELSRPAEPAVLARRERLYAGLRRAGLPER